MKYCNFVLALFLLTGCFQTITDFPEIERPIQMTEFYLDLHNQYETIFNHSSAEIQDFMMENIAPSMNSVKRMIITYNEIILAGGEDPDKKRAILTILRDISSKLTQVKRGIE